ncbi:MAG: hypothetical protein ACTSRW_04655 [Candidatus Helarchaeota archaeon]
MRKLIIISNDEFIRNFIRSDALSEIESEDTYYVASSTMKYLIELKNKNYLASINIGKWTREAFLNIIFPLITFTYKSKSSSFEFRAERILSSYGRNRIYNATLSIFQSILNRVFRRKKNRTAIRPTIYHLIAYIASQMFGEVAIFMILAIFGHNKRLNELIKDLKPDIVIIPSSAADILGTIATRICKKQHVPVLHLISGWDNLSSKIVYPFKPDYLCVWGPQSKEFARDIHGIPPNRVFEIGVPTFDSYFHLKRNDSKLNSLKSPYDFEYALFAGCAVPFDEISALQMLEESIERANLEKFKIVYRPHPWRQTRACPDTFEPQKFKHVVLDEQMKENYYKSKLVDSNMYVTRTFLPSLDYYPRLLHNARFVICPLSTMTLESLIFERSVLCIVYNDGIHITSPHNLLRYDHFDGLEDLEGVYFCKNKADFGNLFLSIYEATRNQKKSKILEQIKYYIYYDDESYAKRLKKVLDNLSLRSY